MTACKSYCCSYRTVRCLEADCIEISVKIRDCEQPVLIARELLEELGEKAKREAVMHGFKFGAAGVATIGKINFKLKIFVLVILQLTLPTSVRELATGALKLNFPSEMRISEQGGLI